MSANGNKYDWESITVNLTNGEVVGITEIKYEDGQDPARLRTRQLRGQRQHGAGP